MNQVRPHPNGLHLHTSLPSASKLKQMDGLQIMRAVAVVLVTWGHTGLSFGIRLPDFGIFGIDLFFVISGFIMSSIVLHTRESSGWQAARTFMARRLIRIYPIYWIYAALCAIRIWHNGYLVRHNFWYAVFLLPAAHHWRFMDLSWTLMFEVFFYAVMGALMLVTVRYAVPILMVLFTGLALLSRVLDMTAERWDVIANPILLEFVFGAAIALLFRRYARRKAIGVGLLIAGTVAALYIRHKPPAGAAEGMASILYGGDVMLRALSWGAAAALIIGGIVFWSPSVRGRTGKLAVVIGNASYSAYLASALVMEYSNRALQRVHRVNASSSLGWIFIYQIAISLLVLLTGWVSYQFVEWPLVRHLQQRYTEPKKRRVPTRADGHYLEPQTEN